MTAKSSSAVDGSSDAPRRVTFLSTILTTFRYPTALSVGKVIENGVLFPMKLFHNRYFKFHLKKTTQDTVSLTCEIYAKDETSNTASAVEADASGLDDGCFLRLYISMTGVREETKSAVLRSSRTSASVEFREAFLLKALVDVKRLLTFKCVVRRIETTIISNEFSRKQEVIWQGCMFQARISEKQEKDMSSLLKRSKAIEVLTGRRTPHNESPHIISRACRYSKELVQYFQSMENSEPVPPTIDVGLILGHLYDERESAISGNECRNLYLISVAEGLMFVKELCTHFIIENLNDELVVDAVEIAHKTEDARLFQAAFLYFRENVPKCLDTDKWKLFQYENRLLSLSIFHGFLVRCSSDNLASPPAMEDETGEP